MKTSPQFFFAALLGGFGMVNCRLTAEAIPESAIPTVIVNTQAEPVATGRFAPTWGSLSQYRPPDRFRDAKLGIWAHGGPQCQPEQSDWYARDLYTAKLPSGARRVDDVHRRTYGHPAKFGFKDAINTWKAEHGDPDALMALSRRAGAQYFVALANHDDTVDLWDSPPSRTAPPPACSRVPSPASDSSAAAKRSGGRNRLTLLRASPVGHPAKFWLHLPEGDL